jgi:hypothetical protein
MGLLHIIGPHRASGWSGDRVHTACIRYNAVNGSSQKAIIQVRGKL